MFCLVLLCFHAMLGFRCGLANEANSRPQIMLWNLCPFFFPFLTQIVFSWRFPMRGKRVWARHGACSAHYYLQIQHKPCVYQLRLVRYHLTLGLASLHSNLQQLLYRHSNSLAQCVMPPLLNNSFKSCHFSLFRLRPVDFSKLSRSGYLATGGYKITHKGINTVQRHGTAPSNRPLRSHPSRALVWQPTSF